MACMPAGGAEARKETCMRALCWHGPKDIRCDQAAATMRGAARDFVMPPDMRRPEAARPYPV
jgi:hypothetical protein